MTRPGDRLLDADRPLLGCTIAVTRERPGELARLLAAAGAEVVHAPLIKVVDPPEEDQRALVDAFAANPEWVAVTSPAGAERVGAAVRHRPEVRLAAVGTMSAQRLGELAGRPVDLVPDRQLGAVLAAQFNGVNATPVSVLVAQADRAGPDLVEGLRAGGHAVTAVTAYNTVLRRPMPDELAMLARCDAVLFASGSAAAGWAAALGAQASELLPQIVVVIGPTTAAAAWDAGLKVTDIAADHSVAGLVAASTLAWRYRAR